MFEKNYRLQDIQLSKSLRSFATRFRLRLASVQLAQPSRTFAGLPTEARFRVSSSWRRLVENTGLEPVTSWLQTRRSPS